MYQRCLRILPMTFLTALTPYAPFLSCRDLELWKAKMIKILLVEDSKFLRLATERALVHAGYELSSAGDGDEALRLARERIPDLILLDLLVPKTSGLDVLKALKQDSATKSIPVVVMSGMSQKNAARLAHDGAVGFLEKSDLELDKGSAKLLAALQEILKKLPCGKTLTTTA